MASVRRGGERGIPRRRDNHLTRMTAPAVSLCEVEGTPDNIAMVHRLLGSSLHYSMVISGSPPSAEDAAAVFSSCPPTVSRRDKHVYAISTGEEIIGIADVLNGYPSPGVAFIGLLLISGSFQRRGFGRSSLERIIELAIAWGCTRLRLAVVEANGHAAGFWLRSGFTDTGTRVPYENGSVSSQSMIFERELPRRSATPVHCASFEAPANYSPSNDARSISLTPWTTEH